MDEGSSGIDAMGAVGGVKRAWDWNAVVRSRPDRTGMTPSIAVESLGREIFLGGED